MEVALLQRLVASPFTRRRFWDERPRIALLAGEVGWIVRDRGLLPLDELPVDATIRCSQADLAAMAAGSAPSGSVSYTLGTRDGADRRKQARVLLALAALGWCGRWPDPEVDPEHVRMLRAAHYHLGIGPPDREARLFPEGGPLPEVTVWITYTAAGTELATAGLADVPGRPEVAALAPGREELGPAFARLRAAALWAAEHGRLPTHLPLGPRTLTSAPHPRFPDGLALPNQVTWLLRVGEATE